MAVIGIDLGTTYSAIATPQSFSGEFFETLRGVTLIKDDYKQRLTPSVVAVNRQEEILVGRRAKALAGRRPEPVMFVKRSMGEAKEFVLGERRLQPEEVSAQILRYLKDVAEKQMKEEVEQAVITVPAYFNLLQKQKTEEAGKLAGLRVGEILQEPVAAALSYCFEDERDPLTIMTYDLGGGTFDVAVLRKEDGVFEVKAFDGDRFLGGYDFDKQLAFWIFDQLKGQNYQLADDPESAEFRAAFSKLLVLAETAKIKLTDTESYVLNEPNSGIVDVNGEPVSVDLEIPRALFEEQISDKVDETLRLCRRALEKASLETSALDEIVMVGGSSRVPLITRRLEAELGCRPRLNEPELSVVVGAAMLARRLGRRVGLLAMGHVPEVTRLASVQITGTVETGAELTTLEGCRAVLIPADGSLPMRENVAQHGGFIFSQVPLAPDAENVFELKVEDGGGREVVTHQLAIHRQADAETGPSVAGLQSNVLAKPISIMTVEGLRAVAEEKTELPCEKFVPAQTADRTGQVRVPIYEEAVQIGEIVVDGVSTELPTGTGVEITLSLREDFSIEGRALIPATQAKGHATIRLPPVVVKGLAELQSEYLALSRQANEALHQADRGQAFGVAPRLKAALAASQKQLYEERDPNLGKAQELLAEVQTLIAQLTSWQPEPPAEEFERLREEIEDELLPALYAKKATAADGSYEGQLKAIVDLGKKALEEKSETGWTDANRRLVELRDRIRKALVRAERPQAGGGQEKAPDPRALKMKLGMELTRLREECRRRGRLGALKEDITECERQLRSIDAGAPDAISRISDYYENYYQPLVAKVEGAPSAAGAQKGWIKVFSA